MTDSLPAWLWVSTVIILCGYLAADSVARRWPRVSAFIAQALADWRECRAEYDLALEAAYERAAAATNDRLLNARGRRAGIDPLSLFMGPERRAHAYASPELLEHWAQYPRVTYAAYERQWMAEAVTR
jgi:hypothetical protein